MDNETQPAPKRRGRRPKSETAAALDASKLKRIDLDPDLRELIEKKSAPADAKPLKAKVPASMLEELEVNIASLNQSGNTRIDQNAYVRYALEMANENLSDILRRHLSS
jgi:hypothetical protein